MPRQQQFSYTNYLSQGRPDSQRPAWEAAGSPKSQQAQKPFDYMGYLRQGMPESQRPAWEAAGSPKSRPQQPSTPFSAYAPQQQSPQYGQQQPYQQQSFSSYGQQPYQQQSFSSFGQQPFQQQWNPGQAQPMGPQSQGTPYSPSIQQQQFPTYQQQPSFAPGGGLGNMAYAAPDQRPAPFQQSTAMFGQQVNPAQAFAQRGAFVQNLMDSRAQHAQQWGMGNYQPPPSDFGTLWGQAGNMVQQGWQNPFSQAQPIQPPSQGTPYAPQLGYDPQPIQPPSQWTPYAPPQRRDPASIQPPPQGTSYGSPPQAPQQPPAPPKPAFDVNAALKLRQLSGDHTQIMSRQDLDLLAMSYEDYARKFDSGESLGHIADMRRKMGYNDPKQTREQWEGRQKAAMPDLVQVYQRLSQSAHTSGLKRGERKGAEGAFNEIQQFLKQNPGAVSEEQVQKLNSAYQADVKDRRLGDLEAERRRLRDRQQHGWTLASDPRQLNLWRNEYAALEDKIARAKRSPDGNPGTVWPTIR